MASTEHPFRRSNQRLVFDQVRAHAASSRADLAKLTGLSPPTVGKVADELLASGLLEETDSAEPTPSLGRPSRPLRLNTRQQRLIALQIGVRNTRLARLPVAGPQTEDWPIQFATPAKMSTFIERLTQAFRQIAVKSPAAITVSVPGAVDERLGRVLLAPNLPWLHHVDLSEALRPVFGTTPICFVQEIRALALGHLYAQPEADSFILVDFGEGVGGAVVTQRHLYAPPLPLSGELGHSRVLGNTRPCGCGGIGCLETLVSRRGLVRSFIENHGGDGDSEKHWRYLVRHVSEKGIEPWLAQSLDAAGATIGSAMNLLGVRHAVITGALVELPDTVLTRLSEAVRASAMWARFGEITVSPAPRRRAAGLVAMAIDRILLPEVSRS